MNGLYDLGPVVAVPLLVLRYAHAVGGLGVTSHGRQADWLTENTPVNTSYTSSVQTCLTYLQILHEVFTASFMLLLNFIPLLLSSGSAC